MTDKPIIRNLDSLRRDMADELRQALEALRAGELPKVERKVRNTLEFLTGSRE